MRRAAGFTLLEVLVAVTLLSIAVAAVYANFSIGLNSYQKGTKRGELIQQARGGLRFLQSDLGKMVRGAGETGAFTKERLSFLMVADDQESRLQSVTYAIAGSEMIRSVAPAGAKDRDGSSFPLVRGITSAGFEYCTADGWVTDLQRNAGEEQAPLGVRITLGLAAEGEDALFRTAFLLAPPRKKENEKKQEK